MQGEQILGYWSDRWDRDDLVFHNPRVNRVLLKHNCLLFKEGETKKILVPLCGKTLDMKWLCDKGQIVVGVDAVKKPLHRFCIEHDFVPAIKEIPEIGPGCLVFNIKDDRLRLYFCDIYLFNKNVEGRFDCILDTGGLVSVERADLKKYVTLLKDILVPGGKMFVQAFEYESTDFENEPRHPPPHAMFESEIKSLFEPDCKVDLIEKDNGSLRGVSVGIAYYLVAKNELM